MDTALKNGDFQRNPNGIPHSIDGIRELLQRAEIRLKVPLGSFVYDPWLGSRLHTLSAQDKARDVKALTIAQEALREIPELTVEGASCTGSSPMTAVFRLGYSGGNAEIEVKV